MSAYSVSFELEPEIWEQACLLLERAGLPMPDVVSLFLRKIAADPDILLSLAGSGEVSGKLPPDSLTDEQFDSAVQKAMDDTGSGRVHAIEEVEGKFRKGFDA